MPLCRINAYMHYINHVRSILAPRSMRKRELNEAVDRFESAASA